MAYGDNRFKGAYLAYDLTPTYKYFVIQEWHASFSEFVKNDIHSVFAIGDAIWILTAGFTQLGILSPGTQTHTCVSALVQSRLQ